MHDSTEKFGTTKLKDMFFSFLDDKLTPATAEEILQILLRTEGDIHLKPDQLAVICHQWAVKNQEKNGIPIFQSLSLSLFRIYQANGLCSLPDFDLGKFIKPFVNALFHLCPAEERQFLKEELPLVKKRFEESIKVEEKKLMPEFEVQLKVDDKTTVTEGEWTQITGEKFQVVLPHLKDICDEETLPPKERAEQLTDIIDRISGGFENVINNQVLTERLSQLIWPGTELFNRGEIEAASVLFGFVAQEVDRRKDQFLEKEVSSILSIDKLDEEVINKNLNDPDRKKLLKPIFQNVFETRRQNLVTSLTQEEDAEKRKKLMSYLTVYEPEIFDYVIQELTSGTASKWYFKRNLICLTTKVRTPEEFPVSTVLEVFLDYIHPDVHPTLMQESVRAYLFFDTMKGLDFFIRMLKTEHISDVIRLDQFYPPRRLAAFKQDVVQGIGSFDFSEHPKAVDRIIGIAQEEIRKVSFKLGKFGMGLNQPLLDSLLTMLSSSQSPYVVKALTDLATQSNMSSVQQLVQKILTKLKENHKKFM